MNKTASKKFEKSFIDLGLSSDMVNIVNEYFESVDGDL